jgi:hypothetical protein
MGRKDVLAFRSWIFELKQTNLVLNDLPREYSIRTDQSHIGWIIPFTINDLKDNSKINSLVDWRNEHRESFISNGKVNSESTIKWLDKQVLENANRELFWVLNSDKVHIGHVGILYDEVHQRFEVDSILKGINSTKGIMWLSIAFLEKIVHEKFYASHLYLRVLETNYKAINFYYQNGYKELISTESLHTISGSRKIIFMMKAFSPKL